MCSGGLACIVRDEGYMWMRTRLVDALGSYCAGHRQLLGDANGTIERVQNIRRLKLAVNGWEVADAHGAIATTGVG
jgi:hypothetical protein